MQDASQARFDIVSLGEAMVEFCELPEGGGQLYRQGFGGDTSNFAIAAARQGARVAYVSAVGDDPWGARLRALWDAEGIDHTGVRTDPQACTGLYFVRYGPAGHAFSFHRKGSAASRLDAATLPLSLVVDARLLHVSGITLAISGSACEAAFAAIEAGRRAGRRVSFDTNLRLQLWPLERAREVMHRVMQQCDICLPSFDDIAALTGLSDPDALVDHCLAQGARVVALKLGDRGALVANGRERFAIPPFACRPVDATGAGDMFGGTFVARLLAGDPLQRAGELAAVAAALSTEAQGAVSAMPTREQVFRKLGEPPGLPPTPPPAP